MTGYQGCKRAIVLFAAVVCTSVPGDECLANGSLSQEVFLVSVFDCYMPIPNNFVLNSRDRTGFALFLGEASDAMRIKISQYNDDLASTFTQLEQRSVEGLIIEELQSSVRRDLRVTRIHNKGQQIMVYGATDELIRLLVQGCLHRKHGELFAE